MMYKRRKNLFYTEHYDTLIRWESRLKGKKVFRRIKSETKGGVNDESKPDYTQSSCIG